MLNLTVALTFRQTNIAEIQGENIILDNSVKYFVDAFQTSGETHFKDKTHNAGATLHR